ncbi:MAG: TetR/AcrR family transcriptional regulator [Acidimicrobiales bacterium]|nr:TetR/AcrR family transcriptional regulator [Acidimicrobiales bacterium]
MSANPALDGPLSAAKRTPAKSSRTRAGKDSAASGVETREKLLAAARACLRDEGIAGVSARAIARHGDLNQALVFYHYGSVDGLLQAVARNDSERRARLYEDRLADVSTLKELVSVGRQIHDAEMAEGTISDLTQLLAGAASSPDLGAALYDGMQEWTTMVEEALARVVADTPLASMVPLGDVAYALASLFLGLELMGGIDGDHSRVGNLFDSLDAVSGLVDVLLRSGAAGS